MKASIITPNFNGMKFLKNFLDSLNNEYKFIGEVILIDNGSTDGSQDFIKNYSRNLKFPVKIVENTQNLGFSRAVNQGIKISSFEYLFLLNNDTEVKKGTIYHLINCLTSDTKIFSVSAKILQYDNPNLIDDAGDEYTLLAWTKKSGNNQLSDFYKEKREIFSSCAGAAMYRRNIFDIIGYFDENFFAYMEDVDISYRAKIYGFKNYFCPEAIVYHVGSGTTGSKYNEFKVKISARNNVWLIYKNFPIPQKIINFIFFFIGFLIKYFFFLNKGFGSTYLSGLKEGFYTRNKLKKTKFKSINTKNYFKIEWKLIVNTFKLLKK